MDPRRRKEKTFTQLKAQLGRAYRDIPFYRHHWDAAGFDPATVNSFEDFTERCPVITKKMLVADQAEHPPFGSYAGIPRNEVWRIHGSSGTSGRPTMYGVSKADWDRSRESFALTHWSMGMRPSDTVHLALPFGLFFGAWGLLYAAEEIGATCLPLGTAETGLQLDMIDRMGCTFIEGTPSYLLHMAEVAQGLGWDPAASSIKRALTGAEPGGSVPATKARIMEAWGLETCCDSGTSSEMFPFCTSTECTEMNGFHVYYDDVWTEIVDPDDPNKSMPEGEIGKVVYTHIWRESQPMIRFSVGDMSFMTDEPCACGRTYPRMPRGLIGRADDMLVIRGMNIYPSTIEQALRSVEGIGMEYRIRLTRPGNLDEITVEAEVEDAIFDDPEGRGKIEKLAGEALKRDCMIRVPVSVVAPNSLARPELKAQRVIDERPA